MPRPRTIQLFLMDGTTTGRRKATIDNWTGVAYLLPRTDIHVSDDRPDLKNSGVYLLFGTDEATGTDKVYIGQAGVRKNGNGTLGRIKEHIDREDRDYWTHALALVTSNGSFGATDISYLENAFVTLARQADRFEVTNGNEPNQGSVTEEKRAELDGFIETARTVIGALGFRVFEPVDDVHTRGAQGEGEPVLHMKHAGAQAQGRQTSDGFVVLKGSRLRAETEFTESSRPSIARNRMLHAQHVDEGFVLTADVLLGSPSAAAEFVGGGSLNGRTTWKDASGTDLKTLESRELNTLN